MVQPGNSYPSGASALSGAGVAQGGDSSSPSLSIIIPAYRSAQILPELVTRLDTALQALRGRIEQWELIITNDGSPDNTWAVIEELSKRYPWIHGIDMMRNYGQHNALLCAIRAAQYNIIVTMDDDLQHPPDQIATLLDKLEQGYDVVYGTPRAEQHGLWRDMASKITKLALQSAMGADTARSVSAFRMFRTQLRDAFAQFRGPYVSLDVLLTWATTRFAAVSVPHAPRLSGVSNYTFRKLISHALNMVTGFSILPLQLASLTGFAFTILGIILLIYVIGRFVLEGGSVPGFPFLASAIAIFSGAQLFALGIMGEYLARMHFRMMDRPAYTVRSTTFTPQEIHTLEPDPMTRELNNVNH